MPKACVTLPLGYGRTSAGRVGDGVGFDAYRLHAAEGAAGAGRAATGSAASTTSR